MSRADLARKAIDWAVKHAEPVVDDVIEAFAAKRAPRPRQKPKVGYDNPGGDWLKYQRKNAAESGRPVSGAVTAYTRKPIMLDPKKVRKLPGHNAERRGPGDMQYDALRPSVEKHGLYEKSPILIGVNYRGDPYIIEGNTRTAVADDLGLAELPAEIRWFAGGEEVPEAMLRPDNIEEFMAQSELMRDPRFRRYFEGSKLTDEYGEPMRLYHATPENFSAFKAGGKDPALSGKAIWLSPYADRQPAFHNIGTRSGDFKEGTNVMPVYARMRNPLLLDNKTMHDWASEVFADRSRQFPLAFRDEWIDNVRSAGYDGIINRQPGLLNADGTTTPSDEIVIFDPKQIKSAIGNRGTYDPDDPDITKARGGLAVKPVWDKKRPKDLGKPKSLSVKKKKSAKARAAAAGRPYPNLIDNMAAARKKGK